MSDVDDHSTHEEEVEEEPQPAPVKQPSQNNQQKQHGQARKAQRTKRIKVQEKSSVKTVTERKKLSQPSYDDDDEDDGDLTEFDEESYDHSPSALLITITNLWHSIVSIFCGAMSFLCGTCCGIVTTVTSCLSHVMGFLVFYALVYVFSTFLVSKMSSSQLSTFSSRMAFVVQSHSWSMLPVVCGFVSKQLIGGAAHAKFVREVIEQFSVMFINSLILSTYLSAADASNVWTAILILAIFRLIQWISLIVGVNRFNKLLSSTPQMCNIVLGAYNVWAVALTSGAGKA